MVTSSHNTPIKEPKADDPFINTEISNVKQSSQENADDLGGGTQGESIMLEQALEEMKRGDFDAAKEVKESRIGDPSTHEMTEMSFNKNQLLNQPELNQDRASEKSTQERTQLQTQTPSVSVSKMRASTSQD